ncbi:hypothetical protein FQN57_000445 [Myotisia sp. PD_48]|nr:hypothetical protein FQN57_000445 [Myotisia sp. PD_48]
MRQPISLSSLLLLISGSTLGVTAQLDASGLAPRDGQANFDPPQIKWESDDSIMASNRLSPRAIFGIVARQSDGCRTGWAECAYDTDKCCPAEKKCCTNGYCAAADGTCCPDSGTCPKGWGCCGKDHCYPIGGDCCDNEFYCEVGRVCRTYKGERKCCLKSGCVGENDSKPTTPIATAAPDPTETFPAISMRYYTTTITWYFDIWVWSSVAPYTTSFVTSTRTSTSTRWSAFASDEGEAKSELADRSSTYSFPTPALATILQPLTSLNPKPTGSAAPAPSRTPSPTTTTSRGAGSSMTPLSSPESAWVWVLASTVVLPIVLFAVLA